MQNILQLETTLKQAKNKLNALDKISPRIKTDIIIDLQSPEGNIFYIMGLCNWLAKKYNLTDWSLTNYKKLNYQQILDICQKQFGLIYING